MGQNLIAVDSVDAGTSLAGDALLSGIILSIRADNGQQ